MVVCSSGTRIVFEGEVGSVFLYLTPGSPFYKLFTLLNGTILVIWLKAPVAKPNCQLHRCNTATMWNILLSWNSDILNFLLYAIYMCADTPSVLQ